MTIDEKQEENVKELSLLDGDQEMTIYYVMELGQKLPTFSESDR